MSQFLDPLPGVRDAAAFRLRNPKRLAALQLDPNGIYEMRVFSSAAETVSLFEELEHTIELLARINTFPELSAVSKLYVIGWISLSDVLANLLNHVLDLGIEDQDVKFGAILRNQHVRRSGLPDVVKRYAKAIQYEHFKKLRNDIVHRGKLGDTELMAIHSDWLMALFQKTKGLPADDETVQDSATEATRTEARVEERARALIVKRQQEYREHLVFTRAFFAEIADVIVPIIESYPV
jgi:hypothetical protein